MGDLYRDESGLVFETDPRYAEMMGFEPVSAAEEHDIYAQRGLAARGEERGVLGAVNAGLTRFAGGMSLGATDVALGAILPDAERERLQSDIEAHPYISTAAEIAGGVLPALAAPGSAVARTPAGYLSSLAAREVESGLARGGAMGVGRAVNAMGLEGAVQSAGQYIGHAALADVDVTAEGLSGALGTGYAFGAVGGGVALGVTKGAIEARKLYSRTFGASDAKAAESTWSTAHQEALEADTATMQTAQARLEEIRKAKAEALRYRNEARNTAREESLYAQANPDGNSIPMSAGPDGETMVSQTSSARPQGGMPTSVFKRPEAIDFDPVAARDFDARMPTPGEGPEPLIDVGPQPQGAQTAIFRRPAAVEPTELEKALAATKKELDEGTPLGEIAAPGSAVSPQIPPGKTPPAYAGRNPSSEIERMLAEKGAVDAMPRDPAALAAKLRGEVPKGRMSADEAARLRPDLEMKGPVPPQYGPTARAPFSNLRSQLTKQLLDAPIAKIESELIEALNDFEIARKDFLDLATDKFSITMPGKRAVPGDFLAPTNPKSLATGDLAGIRASGGTGVGKLKSIEALDRAHEEALLRARETLDPREAGRALFDAEELEKALNRLNTDPTAGGVPQDFLSEIEQGVRIIDRYEKAAAKLTEVVGEGAHPISIEKGAAFSKANDEAVRKTTDRTTRAVEDAETFGPEYKTPKERAHYAKERQLEADKAYADISADMIDAKDAASKANKKVAESEKARKAALRVDAKAGAAGSKGAGAAEKLGALEILDLPGMPKLSDLPVVGPLLGTWLKYRTLKAALGRKMGKVPATADNKVAALAARTRDRIGRAIDRSLGAIEKGGKYSSRIAPPLAGILANRFYDDGEPSPKKGAPIQDLAAARIRELAAYVHTPNAIERDVRRELRGVVDPDIILAAEKHRRAMMEYLLANAPKGPEQGLINTVKWQPSPAQAMSFARRVEAVSDPAGVYERLASEQAMLSLEAAEAMRTVYPQLFSQAQQRVQERLAESPKSIPYRQRVQMSLLYKLPFDVALSPDNLKISQSVYERKVPIPPLGAPQPPMPSVAGETNLTALFQTTSDRRAMR